MLRDLRVAWAVAVLDLRRWAAMATANMRRRDPEKRQNRRAKSPALWMALLAPAMLSQSALLAIALLAAVERTVDTRMVVSAEIHAAMRPVTAESRPGREDVAKVRSRLEADPWLAGTPADERSAWISGAVDRYRAEGSAAFAPREPIAYILSCPPPSGTEARTRIAGALGAGIAALMLAVVALRIGIGNRDLGRADDPRQWLRTLPVSDRALAAARWLNGLIDPFAWLILPPVLIAVALRYGAHGTVWPALVQSLAMIAAAAALAVAAEELVRRTWSHTGRRWAQAAGTLVGMAVPVLLFAAGAVPALSHALLGAGAWLPARAWVAIVPATAGPSWTGIAAASALAVAAGLLAMATARPGRADTVGSVGGRGARPAQTVWAPLPALAKDLLLVRRDPELLLAIVLLPALMVAFNLVMNLHMIGAALADPRHLAVVALAAGGYAASMAAMRIVPSDRPHLWLLWTVPVDVGRILAAKSAVIALVAGAFCVLGLATGAVARPSADWVWLAPYALVAVVVHAALVTGMVALSLEPGDAKRPVKPSPIGGLAGLVVLGLLVAGIYNGWWAGCVALALVAAGAVAVWQRAIGRLRWLMDQGDRPPPRIDALAGIGAAIAFVVLQMPVMLASSALGLPTGPAVLASFAISGTIAGVGALLGLRLSGMTDILRGCGILPNDGGPAGLRRGLGGVALGVATGLAGAAWAVCWTVLARRLGLDLPEGSELLDGPWLAVLAVVCAPLVEELLFRGLILGGLASSLRPAWAIAGSALIFAVVHPPLGFPAVAMMGLACGILYHRTRWLVAPVCCHATYNLVVVLLSS